LFSEKKKEKKSRNFMKGRRVEKEIKPFSRERRELKVGKPRKLRGSCSGFGKFVFRRGRMVAAW